jgi:cytoskeletal protein RodZ
MTTLGQWEVFEGMSTDAMAQSESRKARKGTTDRARPVADGVPIARAALLGALAAIAAGALPAAALAQTTTTETGSGYSATPTLSTSTTTTSASTTTTSRTTTTTTAEQAAKPTSEESTGKPTKEKAKGETKPASERKRPAVTPAAKEEVAKPTTAKALPFTGLNLAWVIGGGLLLLGAGVTIRVAQRRHG